MACNLLGAVQGGRHGRYRYGSGDGGGAMKDEGPSNARCGCDGQMRRSEMLREYWSCVNSWPAKHAKSSRDGARAGAGARAAVWWRHGEIVICPGCSWI